MKKVAIAIGLAAALVLLVAGVVQAGVGLDAWFMVEPGCVVESTPYADYAAGRLGARTFNRPVITVDGEQVARMQLNGDVYYDITLWCPGMVPTSQGTIYVAENASGMAKFWLPLHNQDLWECGPFAVYDALP